MDPFASAEEFRNLLYAISHPGEIVKVKTPYPYISIPVSYTHLTLPTN